MSERDLEFEIAKLRAGYWTTMGLTAFAVVVVPVAFSAIEAGKIWQMGVALFIGVFTSIYFHNLGLQKLRDLEKK